jgi:hypothetical protein
MASALFGLAVPRDVTIGVTIIASPFLVWGVLGVVARGGTNLRSTVHFFRPVRWALAVVASALVIGAVFRSAQFRWLLPIGMSIACSSFGFAIVENWIRRKFFPELAQSEEPDE